MAERREHSEHGKGDMTVREAGHLGGEKGGEVTKERYGPEFYSEIGHKGGQKVKKLIEEGKEVEEEGRT